MSSLKHIKLANQLFFQVSNLNHSAEKIRMKKSNNLNQLIPQMKIIKVSPSTTLITIAKINNKVVVIRMIYRKKINSLKQKIQISTT